MGVPVAPARGGGAGRGPLRGRDRPVGDVTADESIRRDTTLEKLAALQPVFDPEGTTTAGNAPGVNDGASCVIVCSEELAARRGLEPLATILAQGYVADDYAYLARTPARAGEQALAKAGKTIGDVKRVEINEAFASVAKNSTRMLGADEAIVNVNGGAVALGHPIGASGGRIVGTMVHELRRKGGGLGLAAICSGRRAGRRPADRGLIRSLLVSRPRARSCSRATRRVRPASTQPIEERLDESDAAFVGRIVSERGRGSPGRAHSGCSTFEVDQRVKGDVPRDASSSRARAAPTATLVPSRRIASVGLLLTRAAGRAAGRERVQHRRAGRARRRGRRAARRR